MRRSWASVTVGALVVVISAISYFLIRSTVDHASGAQGYAVWGLFHDASALFEKSRVQTAGISVGQIESRTLEGDTAQARITLRVLPQVKLYENAVISKKSASLLGEYYLELDPGTPFAEVNGKRKPMRVLKDGDRIIHTVEPVAFGDLMSDVGTMLPILRDILGDVRKLTGGSITDIAENVNRLIANNAEVLSRLLGRVDRIAAGIEGVTLAEADDVKHAIRNVREITESIKGLVGTTGEQIADNGGAMRGVLGRLDSAISSLDKTMKNVEELSARTAKGQGTVGHLLTDDTIAQNVESITEDAGSFVRGVTKLQTIVGLRSEYNFLSRSFKSYLSIVLLPRPDKFYLVELVDDPRGFPSTTRTLTDSSATGPEVETRTKITDQLRFTLMFGKRVGPVAGRFGIKESTGGLGADLFLFDDRLLLSADVFDTHSNEYPRLRASLAYSVWKRNLLVVGGVDDILNSPGSGIGGGGGIDWFLGAQLTFNDEDLKSLLLFGGGFIAGAASTK